MTDIVKFRTGGSWRGGLSALVALQAVLFAAGCGSTPESEDVVEAPEGGVVMSGRLVTTLVDGSEIREVMFYRGTKMRFQGQIDERRAPSAERVIAEAGTARKLSEYGIDELADGFRARMLYRGKFDYLQDDAAYDVASKALEHQDLMDRGEFELAADLFPATAPGAGKVSRPLGEDQEAIPEQIQKAVIGTDNRTVQNNLTGPNAAVIVVDNTSTGSGINGAEGTAFMIARSTAMSVAHVFWDEAADTWEAWHRWSPGFDSGDASTSPWGDFFACYNPVMPQAYATNENFDWDYIMLDFISGPNGGCNVVSDGVNSNAPGDNVGWFGTIVAADATIEAQTVRVNGYPAVGTCGSGGASCGVRIWGHSDVRSGAGDTFPDATGNQVRYTADTTDGQSGSPAFALFDPAGASPNGNYIFGMHRGASGSENHARRWDAGVRSFVVTYSPDL
jgi:V8-like Glu-specific endopeptidase